VVGVDVIISWLIDDVYIDLLLGTPYSVDRSEEVVMGGYQTTTLDLKRRNRSSVPYADTEDDVRLNPHLFTKPTTLF